MRRSRPNPVKRCALGFTLLETLVALVVLSVGMLGIAALYMEGLKAARSALMRTAAVSLAADMADRIRANPTAGLAWQGPPGGGGCINGGADCAPPELAAEELEIWLADVAARIPNGQGQIQVAEGPVMTTYDIQLDWVEPGQADPMSYNLRIEL